MKKWAIWKTLAIVISSVILVSGMTVLGVYLAGGFKTKVVNPDSISFMLDEKIYNPENNQFEVTSDFNLTIEATTSSTDPITNNRIELSLDNGITYTVQETDENGIVHDIVKVRNDVISVPQYVTIGQPFTVSLRNPYLRDSEGNLYRDENNNLVNWITGGIATITATSQNKFISPVSARIAVDTPVYSIETKAIDFAGKELDSITLNENFTLKTTFFPANSAYLFNDQFNDAINEKRERRVFFESTTNNIVPHFDENNERYFIAADSPSDNNTIMAYTFESARNQIDRYNQIMMENEENEQTAYNQVVLFLKGTGSGSKSCALDVSIVKALIKNFNVLKFGQTMEMTVGRNFTLTMQSTPYADDFIGAQVISTNDEELLSMLKNVAICFEYTENNGKTWVDASNRLNIVGGDVVDYVDKDGRKFYFADTTSPNTQYAFWRLSSNIEDSQQFRMTIVLFIEGESGYEIFKDSSANEEISYVINLNAVVQNDEPVSWANTEDINITLDYDGDNTVPRTYALSNLAVIPEENVYKTVKFFARFAQGVSEETIKNILRGNPVKQTYTFGASQPLDLYLVSNEITVYDTGEFELYFATVQTDSDGKEIVQEDGKYIIIQAVNSPIKVNITKTLYEGSVEDLRTETTQDPTVQDGNIYYFNSGINGYPATDKTITLIFDINSDSWGVFVEKINAGRIQLTLSDGTQNINNYFTISNPVLNNTEHKVSYTLNIKNTFANKVDNLKLAKATLQDLDNSNLAPWERNILDGNYYLYTPEPQEITLESDTVNFVEPVQVKQSLSNDGAKLTISYVGKDGNTHVIESNAVEEFIKLFKVTVVDQHNNTDIFKNSWSFGASDERVITLNGTTFTFPSTEGTTTLYARVSSGTGYIETTNKLTMIVSSTGIQKIESDQTYDVLENQGQNDITLKEQTSLSIIDIQKYGASYATQDNKTGGYINFDYLVKLYYSDGIAETQYLRENYKFNFSSQYLESLEAEKFKSLFGKNGMITISGNGNGTWEMPAMENGESDSQYLSRVKADLTNFEVRGLTFNHNFAVGGEKLEFIITDKIETGVVRITMNFTILANVTYQSNSTEIGKDNDVYAMAGKTLNSNEDVVVNYQNGEDISLHTSKQISGLLSSLEGNYYIVDDGNTYKISKDRMTGGVDVSVGEIVNGAFKFYDFWDVPEKSFKINFYLEGIENQFTPFYTFNFKVQRNIKVENVNTNNIENSYKFVLDGQISNKVKDYISVSRIKDISNNSDEINADIANILSNISFELESNPFINIVQRDDDWYIERTSITPIFKYNETDFIYKITVYIQEANQDKLLIDDTKTIKFESGVEYKDLADRFIKNDGNAILKAEVQNLDGVDYLKVTTDKWKLNNLYDEVATLKNYKFETARHYYDYSSGSTIQYRSKSNFYSFQNTDDNTNQDVTFLEIGNSGLFGLGDPKEYLVVRVLNRAGDLQIVMLVPCVVSRIGTVHAYYDKFDEEGAQIEHEYVEATLQDLLTTNAKTLIDENKFKAVDAGQYYVIASPYASESETKDGAKLYYYSTQFKQSNIAIEEIKNDYSRNNLATILSYDMLTKLEIGASGAREGDVVLKLNHLVGDATDYAYVTLKATISGEGFSQEIYYIVRVKPNATLGNIVYPYGDDAEYIISAKRQDGSYTPVEIKLDEAHDKTTCNFDSFRFNVYKNDDRLSALPVVDTIKSVSDGVNTYENQADYANLVEITFNTRENNTDNSIVTITPKTDRKLTIILSREYQTVVGGEFEYTIIVNDEESNLQLEFEDLNIAGKDLTFENGVYKWKVKREKTVNNYISTKINLRDRNAQGEGSSSTLKYGLLSINPKGVVANNSCEIYYNNQSYEQIFNNEGEIDVTGETINSNTLTLILDEYIEKDKLFEVYLYSQFGLLGTLQIEIEGSVTYEQIQESVKAGTSTDLLNLIENVKINGNIGVKNGAETADYSFGLTKATIQNQGKYSFVTIENGKIKALPNIEDVEIKLDIELWVVVDGKTEKFTFTLPLAITKNITNLDSSNVTTDRNNPFTLPRSTDGSDEIFAEDTKELLQADIFNVANSTDIPSSQNIKYTWTAISGGNAFESGNNNEKVLIQTKEVGLIQNCSALLEVSLMAGGAAYNTFYARYNFTVKPNVVVETNASAPQGTELYESDAQGRKIGYEYLQDGVSFVNVLDNFINTQPVFVGGNDIVGLNNDGTIITRSSNKNISGKYNRFVVYKATVDESLISTVTNNFTLNIISMQNADVYAGDYTILNNHFTSVGGSNTVYGKDINVSNLTFKIGTWRLKEGSQSEYEWNDDGNQSRITFQLTCNSVVAEYTIILVKDLYGITFNRVNNNLDSSGSVESFYADRMTESPQIFENERMLNLSVVRQSENDNISSLVSDKFEMLFEKFEDEKYYYSTKPLTLSRNDIGQIINIDLGKGLAGYRYIGTFLEGKILDIGGNTPSTEQEGKAEQFKPATKDFTTELFNKTPQLVSRVQLTYNQINVDFDKFAGELRFENNSGNGATLDSYQLEQTGSDLDKVFTVKDFKFSPNDGSTVKYLEQVEGSEATTERISNIYEISGVAYSYKLTLDIQVRQALEFTEVQDEDGKITPTKVNEKTNNIEAYTQQNLISTMGVYHPSTGNAELFKDSEFMDDNINLNLYVVGLDKALDESDEYIKRIREVYTSFNATVDNNGIDRYLAISAIQKRENGELVSPETVALASDKIYTTDYYIRGLGAENKGNYVLLYMTYSVKLQIGEGDATTYSKGFYIMMKVMPDYKIVYEKAGAVEPDENGIISNQGENRIYTLNEVVNNGSTYLPTILAGNNNSTNPIVSVKHKNDTTGNEIAAQDFKYEMQIDDERDGTLYNIELNVKNKLKDNVLTTGKHWAERTEANTTYYTWENSADNGEISLAGAKEVKFGVQYYRLEAQDKFGYKFVVCFALSNKNLISPTLSADNYITEGAGFDVGVKNYQLNITPGETEGESPNTTTILDIFGDDNLRGAQGQGVTILNLEGIEAFGFDKPFWEIDDMTTYENYFDKTKIGSSGGGTAKTGYKLRENTGKQSYLEHFPEFMYLRVLDIDFLYEGKSVVKEGIDIISEGNNNENQVLASDSNLYLTENTTSYNLYRQASSKYIMPSLPGYIYDDNDEVEVEIVITLGYGNGLYNKGTNLADNDIEEKHEVHAKVAVRKSTNFISYPNNVVQDGKEFNVKDYVYITRNNPDGGAATIVNDYSVYDDTLAVVVPANSSVTFSYEAFKMNGTSKEDNTSLPASGYTVEGQYIPQTYTIQNTASYDYVEYRSLSSLSGRTLEKDYFFTINVTRGDISKVKFMYNNIEIAVGNKIEGTGGSDGDNIALQPVSIGSEANKMIGYDRINIENPLRFTSNKIDSLTQYYLISIPQGDKPETGVDNRETVEYRFTQNYTVTGYFYSLKYNYSGQEKQIKDYIQINNDEKSTYVIPLANWTQGMYLTKATRSSSGGVSEANGMYDTFSNDCLNKLDFQITTSTTSGGQASGAATIDEYGNITTNKDFNISSHYITVVIRQKISGISGDWADITDFNRSNYYNHTNSKTLMLRLMPRGTSDTEISLDALKYNTTQVVLTQRVYNSGEIAYEEQIVNLPEGTDLSQATVIPKATTLWKNEVVEKQQTSTFNLKEFSAVKFNQSGVSITDADVKFMKGMPLFKKSFEYQAGSPPEGTEVDTSAIDYYEEKVGDETYVRFNDVTSQYNGYFFKASAASFENGIYKFPVTADFYYHKLTLVENTFLNEDLKVEKSNLVKDQVAFIGEDKIKASWYKHTIDGEDYWLLTSAKTTAGADYMFSGFTLSNYYEEPEDSILLNNVDDVYFSDRSSESLNEEYILMSNYKGTRLNFIVDTSGQVFTILSNFAFQLVKSS